MEYCFEIECWLYLTNEFESNKVAKLKNVSRAKKNKAKKVKKAKQRKKWQRQIDVEIATL